VAAAGILGRVPARLAPHAWVVAVCVLAATAWFARVHRDLPDFEVYRTAATRALAAAPLYRPEDGHWQFKYLPAFALAMAPAALLPDAVARPLWFVLSVSLLVVFVRRSVASIPDRRLTDRALTWLAVLLVGRFYVHELDLGQTNILLGVLLVTALAAIERDRPLTAGALVGLAVFVKPYALILVPWLPIAAGWPSMAIAAVVIVGGGVVPAVVYGWQGNLALLGAWFRTVTQTTAPNLLFPENISLAAMWAKWLGPSDAASMAAALSAVALASIAVTVLWWRRRARSPACLEVGLLLMLVPLLSPQGWDYVLLIATPGFLTLANALPRLPRAGRATLAAALAIVALAIFDLLGRSLYMRLMELSLLSVAVLLLVAALAYVRRRGLA
jgi:hypothetical protein